MKSWIIKGSSWPWMIDRTIESHLKYLTIRQKDKENRKKERETGDKGRAATIILGRILFGTLTQP